MDYRPKCKTVNYKNLRGKHRQISDINHNKILYDPPPRVMEIKAKINKWDLINLKTFAQWMKLSARWKTAFRVGENNSKWSNWKRINLKNIQAAHAVQYHKNGPPNQKTGQRTDISPKKTYRWLTTHEKMLNITHYQRNANQNHNEVPSHASKNGCYQKVYKQ